MKKMREGPCVYLNQFADEYFDGKELVLLSIDVEGPDYELLSEFDFDTHTRKAIIAKNGSGVAARRDLLLSKGYEAYGFTSISPIDFMRSFFKFWRAGRLVDVGAPFGQEGGGRPR